jgi:hypothetical protein
MERIQNSFTHMNRTAFTEDALCHVIAKLHHTVPSTNYKLWLVATIQKQLRILQQNPDGSASKWVVSCETELDLSQSKTYDNYPILM